jgi:hypothetical protein
METFQEIEHDESRFIEAHHASNIVSIGRFFKSQKMTHLFLQNIITPLTKYLMVVNPTS